jgi:hypothetical protein
LAQRKRRQASRERPAADEEPGGPAASRPRVQPARPADPAPRPPSPSPRRRRVPGWRLPADWFRQRASWLRRPLERFREPLGRGERIGLLLAAAFSALILLLDYGSRFGDEPLRQKLEAKMNQQMRGYTVQLGHAHAGPLRLSLTLRDVVIRQQAHPEPPLAKIERIRLNVVWHELLFRHLVGDAVFDRPHLHLDVEQLHEERMKQVKLGTRGWQAALEAVYPLKFNSMEVQDGSLTYVDDEDPSRPLEVTHWMLSAGNIRNLHYADRVYPSPVHTEGLIFGTGHGVVDGHANFLSDPFPAWHAGYRIEKVPLDLLWQFGKPNYELRGGLLWSNGVLEYGPRYKLIDVVLARFEGVRFDYVHSAATATEERQRREKIVAAAKVAETSEIEMRLNRLLLTDAQVGFVNRSAQPPYRIYMDRASFEVLGMSNRIAGMRPQGAVFRLRGRFMGGGSANADATFRPAASDLGAEIAIEHAQLPVFNDVLRAYRRPVVTGGTVSLYSQLTVKDRRLHGYVKAMFDDVSLDGAKVDRGKSLGAKLKDKLIGGLAELMENKKSDTMVLRTEISGTLDAPRMNTGEMLRTMLGNAFGKAIAPGFDRAARKSAR